MVPIPPLNVSSLYASGGQFLFPIWYLCIYSKSCRVQKERPIHAAVQAVIAKGSRLMVLRRVG